MAKANSRRIERDGRQEINMGQMEVGDLVMLDDGSFKVKSTGEKVWVDDDGTLRDKDGNEVDADATPKTLPDDSGLDFTE